MESLLSYATLFAASSILWLLINNKRVLNLLCSTQIGIPRTQHPVPALLPVKKRKIEILQNSEPSFHSPENVFGKWENPLNPQDHLKSISIQAKNNINIKSYEISEAKAKKLISPEKIDPSMPNENSSICKLSQKLKYNPSCTAADWKLHHTKFYENLTQSFNNSKKKSETLNPLLTHKMQKANKTENKNSKEKTEDEINRINLENKPKIKLQNTRFELPGANKELITGKKNLISLPTETCEVFETGDIGNKTPLFGSFESGKSIFTVNDKKVTSLQEDAPKPSFGLFSDRPALFRAQNEKNANLGQNLSIGLFDQKTINSIQNSEFSLGSKANNESKLSFFSANHPTAFIKPLGAEKLQFGTEKNFFVPKFGASEGNETLFGLKTKPIKTVFEGEEQSTGLYEKIGEKEESQVSLRKIGVGLDGKTERENNEFLFKSTGGINLGSFGGKREEESGGSLFGSFKGASFDRINSLGVKTEEKSSESLFASIEGGNFLGMGGKMEEKDGGSLFWNMKGTNLASLSEKTEGKNGGGLFGSMTETSLVGLGSAGGKRDEKNNGLFKNFAGNFDSKSSERPLGEIDSTFAANSSTKTESMFTLNPKETTPKSLFTSNHTENSSNPLPEPNLTMNSFQNSLNLPTGSSFSLNPLKTDSIGTNLPSNSTLNLFEGNKSLNPFEKQPSSSLFATAPSFFVSNPLESLTKNPETLEIQQKIPENTKETQPFGIGFVTSGFQSSNPSLFFSSK